MSRHWLLCLLCGMGACLGTDTGNPALDVEISGCKREAARTESATLHALHASSARYDGLACYEWQRDAGRVRFDAYNFTGSCAVEWEGRGRTLGETGLEFVVQNPSCSIAGCGSCLYDASFSIDTQQTKLADESSLLFFAEDCDGNRKRLGSWQLQAGSDRGLHCEHAAGLVWHAAGSGSCGRLHMPCRSACGSKEAEECDGGLECTAIDEHQNVCLQRCNDDSECPLPEVMRCDGAVCRLLD